MMKMNIKDKKILTSVILITIGILFIIISGVIILTKSDKKENNKNNETDPVVVEKYIEYNGVYQKDDSTIKLFTFNNKLKIIVDDIELYVSGVMEEKDNLLKLEDNGKEYSVKLSTGGIDFETTNELAKSGFYKKTADYNKEEYYLSEFGDTKFIDSKYNCQFKKDDIVIDTLQVADSKIMLHLKSSKTTLYIYAVKENDTEVFSTESDHFNIKVNFLENDKLEASIDTASIPEEVVSYYTDIDGTYELSNRYNEIDAVIEAFSLD